MLQTSRILALAFKRTHHHRIKLINRTRISYVVHLRLSHSPAIINSSNTTPSSSDNTRTISAITSKVIYPNKHLNHFKSLSGPQMRFYRDNIQAIQQIVHDTSSMPHVDIPMLCDDKRWIELQKWLHKLPSAHIMSQPEQADTNSIRIAKDPHIQSVKFVGDMYPCIEWKNEVHFKQHSRRPSQDNSVEHLRHLIQFYQLHSVFPAHSVEARMILSRGLNRELNQAYHRLLSVNDKHKLSSAQLHHLVGNLGLNIVSYFAQELCGQDKHRLVELHSDLLQRRIANVEDMKQKYNPDLNVKKFQTLCEFLIEYYPNYESIVGSIGCSQGSQTVSHLDVMPYLFEMKVLVKMGKCLDYINAYYNRLMQQPPKCDEYYFDIHYNKRINLNNEPREGRRIRRRNRKLYRVFSEKQIEQGECWFSAPRCTPDIVLSRPVWINNKPIYWMDAKCTKAVNCVYDKKRQHQMYRFTKHYGNGAILALGAADLSVVGINDVQILDCSRYL